MGHRSPVPCGLPRSSRPGSHRPVMMPPSRPTAPPVQRGGPQGGTGIDGRRFPPGRCPLAALFLGEQPPGRTARNPPRRGRPGAAQGCMTVLGWPSSAVAGRPAPPLPTRQTRPRLAWLRRSRNWIAEEPLTVLSTGRGPPITYMVHVHPTHLQGVWLPNIYIYIYIHTYLPSRPCDPITTRPSRSSSAPGSRGVVRFNIRIARGLVCR